jgi:repressor of nif and glnA expression
MSNFECFEREQRRLDILRILQRCRGYTINDSQLQDQLKREYGQAVSRDALRTDLAWLSEQDLLKLETVAGLTLAQLTARGHDVGSGLAAVPGVARPKPE